MPGKLSELTPIGAITSTSVFEVLHLGQTEAVQADTILAYISANLPSSGGGGSGLGINQTWQDVTSTRSLYITYTNSTDAPIMLNIVGYLNTANAALFAIINGLNIFGSYSPTGGGISTLSVVVPMGATYLINAGGSPANIGWKELRA